MATAAVTAGASAGAKATVGGAARAGRLRAAALAAAVLAAAAPPAGGGPGRGFAAPQCRCWCGWCRAGGSGRGQLARSAEGAAQSWLESAGYKIRADKSEGGSGWSSFRSLKTNRGEFFVKTSRRPAKAMFEGEALGLQALRAAAEVLVPEVLHYGDDGQGGSFIIMEKPDMSRKPDMHAFGQAMARMHLAEPAAPEAKAGRFGFPVDNTIGGTPQLNPWTDDWVDFFREHRMGFQVKRAGNGGLTRTWQRVLDATDGLRELFADGEVGPAVLHGDLWSGNYAGCPEGTAIFDPAVYYGHHEAEWGMSWCGGFSGDFWRGYREVLPEAPLFRCRRPLYEAYHIINHHNLFRGGYLADGVELLEQLL